MICNIIIKCSLINKLSHATYPLNWSLIIGLSCLIIMSLFPSENMGDDRILFGWKMKTKSRRLIHYNIAISGVIMIVIGLFKDAIFWSKYLRIFRQKCVKLSDYVFIIASFLCPCLILLSFGKSIWIKWVNNARFDVNAAALQWIGAMLIMFTFFMSNCIHTMYIYKHWTKKTKPKLTISIC